ncbi:DUF4062 domain-containing protein [Sphingomonas sp. RS2018]
MQKKYQVFVSSTFRDLQEERQDAIRNILDLGHIPAGMELFPAADTEQLAYIKKVIDECDYYVLIMGGRYGSLDEEGVSFTEREYDYAVHTGKTVLAFPHGDAMAIPAGKVDLGDRMRANLDAFRSKVMAGRLVREWKSREQLEGLVLKALVRAMTDFPATGWIRGDTAASEDILSQLNTVRSENQKLSSALSKLQTQLKPSVSDIADMDSIYAVSYNFTFRDRYGSETRKSAKKLSWEKILTAVAPAMMRPTTREMIATAMTTYLRERCEAPVTTVVYKTDIDFIINQLIALKLARSYNAKAVNAGVMEFIELTEYGRKVYTEMTALRKPNAPTD